jgi:Flp pilus assembly protein TadG
VKHAIDDRGAVMVMATFFALFLVGLVYHVAGVGHAALEQQVMQDAADSVASSTATAKARGMDILALINLVMAAVLAILVALRVLQAVLVVAIAIVSVACLVTQGAACGAMQPLASAYDRVSTIAGEVEPRIKDVLEALADAEDTVNRVTPILAEAEAVYISTRDQYDPAELGFAWPVVEELPTKEGSFEELCERAAENVVYMCSLLLPGDLPDVANDAVGEVVGRVAGSFSKYFCGGGDSPPPDAMTQERAYPLTGHTECDSAEARPDAEDGSCATSSCAACAAWGCSACIEKQGTENYKRGQWTRRTEVWIEIEDGDGHVQRLDELAPVQELVWEEGDPCDGEGHCTDDPICSIEDREDAGDSYPDGAERVTRRAYTLLHGCLIEENIEIEVTGEPLDPDDWPKPRALDEEQLPEGLRLKGFVVGGTAVETRMRRVAVAGGDPGDPVIAGRISFAAAEFLSPDMDLWHMTWRSRLIRFRTGGDGFAAGCSGEFSGECGQVGGIVDGFASGGGFSLPGLEDYIVH